MKVELKYVPVSLVDFNDGQLEGVPANPRTREDSRQEKLAESIEELPEMSEARPPMVLPRDGRYIVIGGNRRLEAFRDLHREEMPVVVLPEDTPVFVGMMNEGLFTGSYGCGSVLLQKQSATQKGGLTDLYNECKLLNKALVCPIQFPSAIYGEKQKMNGGRLHHHINNRYLMPRVLKGDGSFDNIAWDTYPEDKPFTNEPKRKWSYE